jgi:hypothetical protein
LLSGVASFTAGPPNSATRCPTWFITRPVIRPVLRLRDISADPVVGVTWRNVVDVARTRFVRPSFSKASEVCRTKVVEHGLLTKAGDPTHK